MENENSRSGLSAFLSGKGFYIVLVLCVIAIGISGYILLFTGNDTDDLVSNSVSLPGDAADHMPEAVIDLPVSGGDSGEAVSHSQSVNAPVDFGDTAALPESGSDAGEAGLFSGGEGAYSDAGLFSGGQEDASPAGDGVAGGGAVDEAPAAEPGNDDAQAGLFAREEYFWVWPVVSGDIINPRSVDSLVFNPTLGDWRVHNGVDIESAPGSEVMAVSDGLVSRIYRDPLYGMCVEVDHKNGFVSTLCNLTEEIAVSQGQAVTAGQVLGRVGSSAQAEQYGGHVHLEMAFEGQSLDPAEYIG